MVNERRAVLVMSSEARHLWFELLNECACIRMKWSLFATANFKFDKTKNDGANVSAT